jgi:glycosyltransferase involved in cell wall biosynthesis
MVTPQSPAAAKTEEGTSAPATLQLSVVVPTYNRRESLLRTLNALARQTFPADQFEVVVISDGATDGTSEAVQILRTPYRLTFVEQENQGPSVARNHGARRATAPLLVYVDDDIEPVENFLAEHANAHKDDPNLVLIGPQTGPMREAMPHWIAWEHQMLQRQYANFLNGVWKAGPNNLYSGNFSVGREALLAVGGFDERFTRQEDVELGFRLAQRGLHFAFSAKADGMHRPTRTFASWYKTPYEYGRRDVQMARDIGEAQAMALARKHYRQRNRATQLAAQFCIGRPALESLVLGIGRGAVKFGGRRLALVACSMLFNLRYLQGMCRELGGRRQLWRALREAAKEGGDA